MSGEGRVGECTPPRRSPVGREECTPPWIYPVGRGQRFGVRGSWFGGAWPLVLRWWLVVRGSRFGVRRFVVRGSGFRVRGSRFGWLLASGTWSGGSGGLGSWPVVFGSGFRGAAVLGSLAGYLGGLKPAGWNQGTWCVVLGSRFRGTLVGAWVVGISVRSGLCLDQGNHLSHDRPIPARPHPRAITATPLG